jgi:thiamine-phosphate pyrophosphorylase
MTFATDPLLPLYPITDRTISGNSSHFQLVQAMVRGGARWIQIREKQATDRDFCEQVKACVGVSGARILVNDRPDIALVTGAAGVHLGKGDLPVEDARALLGSRAIIGVSTHSVSEAVEACSRPVDYVALGPVFATEQASPRRQPLGVDAIREAASVVTKPLVAIGGINLERSDLVLRAGAASVAVISDLMKSRELERLTMTYLDRAPSWNRIYLVGFMGAGKSSAGSALAEALGCGFVDLDEAIEMKAGMTIAGIFEKSGEPGFRKLESNALKAASRRYCVIVACGGGILGSAENRRLMARSGASVWLRAPLDTMLERCEGSGRRPLLGDRAAMERLLAERTPHYRQAHLEVDSAHGSPGDIAGRIAVWLGDRR